ADILANALGGFLGMVLPRFRRWSAETPRRALGASIVYGVLLGACLVAVEAMQAILPPRTLYWTRGEADGSRYVPFTGCLGEVRVDGVPIVLDEWLDVTAGKGGGGDIAVRLTSGHPDAGVADVDVAWWTSRGGERGW